MDRNTRSQSCKHIQVQYVNAVVGVKKLLRYTLKQAKTSKISSNSLYHGITILFWTWYCRIYEGPPHCFLKKHQTAVILKEHSGLTNILKLLA